MKSKEEVVLEVKVANILIEMIYEDHDKDLYNELATSDLQGYCQVKAVDIIRLVKETKQ
jgi:hypothetical protein